MDAREEALVGLAKRHDTRMLPDLISALEESSIGDRVVEAAYTILELDYDREDWSGQDYVNAPRKRFSGIAPQQP